MGLQQIPVDIKDEITDVFLLSHAACTFTHITFAILFLFFFNQYFHLLFIEALLALKLDFGDKTHRCITNIIHTRFLEWGLLLLTFGCQLSAHQFSKTVK